jgi:hypothetical protein
MDIFSESACWPSASSPPSDARSETDREAAGRGNP